MTTPTDAPPIPEATLTDFLRSTRARPPPPSRCSELPRPSTSTPRSASIRRKNREHLVVFTSTCRHRVLRRRTVHVGTLTGVECHPREIFPRRDRSDRRPRSSFAQPPIGRYDTLPCRYRAYDQAPRGRRSGRHPAPRPRDRVRGRLRLDGRAQLVMTVGQDRCPIPAISPPQSCRDDSFDCRGPSGPGSARVVAGNQRSRAPARTPFAMIENKDDRELDQHGLSRASRVTATEAHDEACAAPSAFTAQ